MGVIRMCLCGLLLLALVASSLGSSANLDIMKSQSGNKYVGTTATTIKGIPCINWKDTLSYKFGYLFPDSSIDDAANYCRNPINPPNVPGPHLYHEKGPWCYTSSITYDECSPDICSTCDPSMCMTDKYGLNYVGDVVRAWDQSMCLNWNGQSKYNIFPDNTADGFPITPNACRNPRSNKTTTWSIGEMPWCYVNSNYMSWKYCDVEYCTESEGYLPTYSLPSTDPASSNPRDCLNSRFGGNYMGTVSKGVSGKDCMRWDQQGSYTNPAHFPDTTISAAENYCRNPWKPNLESGIPEGPWCYTAPGEWEWCDVPYCIQDYKARLVDTCGADYFTFGLAAPLVLFGRLEIYHQGEWVTVCANGFTLDDAKTVCSQLMWDVYRRFNMAGYTNYFFKADEFLDCPKSSDLVVRWDGLGCPAGGTFYINQPNVPPAQQCFTGGATPATGACLDHANDVIMFCADGL